MSKRNSSQIFSNRVVSDGRVSSGRWVSGLCDVRRCLMTLRRPQRPSYGRQGRRWRMREGRGSSVGTNTAGGKKIHARCGGGLDVLVDDGVQR